MEKRRIYKLTQEQFEQLQHFRRMFEFEAEQIQNLCSMERDDVVYGFELGKIHSDLRKQYIDFMMLEQEIDHNRLPDA